MCDFMSWIKKDGKLFYLRDDDIAAKWPNADFKDKIGHSAIEEFYPESRGGKHVESAFKVPKEIAAEIGRGHMDKMARAGGCAGARYSKAGKLNSPWWKKVEAIVKECKSIKYFSNSGTIDPEWKTFAAYDAAYAATYDAARDSAYDAAYAAARDAARAAAYEAAYAAARDAARAATYDAARAAARAAAYDATLLARCEIVEFLDDNQFKIHAQKRMDVWRAGYGLLCDVDGVLYVYKKP